MDKTFKTFDEQVALLKSRGVEFKTSMSKSFAKKVLQRENYYNLINGYKDLFLLKGVSEETFKQGTTYFKNITFLKGIKRMCGKN